MPDASGGGGVAFGLPGGGLVSPMPEALQAMGEAPRWVVWRWTEPAAPGAKPDKPLFRASDPTRHASTQDSGTWGSFAAAMGAVGAAEADGAGYVLRDDAEHVFLDLDNCRDPATGAIADWAERLVEECGSYSEATPSGRGLRIIGLNESFQAPIHRAVAMPDGGRVEVYHRCPRYVTVSGRRLVGAPDELRPICDVAADLLLLAQSEGQGKPDAPPSSAPRPNPDASARPEDIASALAQIPNPDLPWEEWSRVGMAAWRASGGGEDGLKEFIRWSAKSGKHNDAACEERWRHWFHSPPDRTGFASLHRLARMANPLWVKPSLVQGLDAHAATQCAVGGAGGDWEGEVPNAAPQAASAPPEPLTATPFDPAELATLRPREWVYGHFLISRSVSVLGAPGGTGKTAYAVAVALSVALGRPFLDEFVHAPGPVWIYNLEDPRDELLRRVQAALIAHRVRPADLTGRLFLDSGRDRPLVVATRLPDGGVVAMPVVEELIAELQRRGVRLLVVDPFVKSHRLEENRNEQVDFAAALWARVADAAGCAVLLVHHFRKGGAAGDADAFRGASALVDAARAAVSLSAMSERDAERMGVDDNRRRFYVRADNAKLNLAPPPGRAVWLELRSVELPNGDRVQAVARWAPPSAWDGLPDHVVLEVLEEIAAAPPDDLWCAKRQAGERWAGKLLVNNGGRTEEQASAILEAWEENGLLQRTPFTNKNRKERLGYIVDKEKNLQMRQSFGGRKARDA